MRCYGRGIAEDRHKQGLLRSLPCREEARGSTRFRGSRLHDAQRLWQNFNPKTGVKRELWPLFTKAKRLQEKRETADYQETSDGSIDWARECKSTIEESKKFLEEILKLS